jgi:hypothetical protein
MPNTKEIAALLIALTVFSVMFSWKKRNAKYAAVDNIRGPVTNGFLMGGSTLLSQSLPFTKNFSGNLSQMYSPNSWKFHRDLETEYDTVVKLHGMLGVFISQINFAQDRILIAI